MKTLHHVVSSVIVLAVLGKLFKLKILFLLQHCVWVDVGGELLRTNDGWVHVMTNFGLLNMGVAVVMTLMAIMVMVVVVIMVMRVAMWMRVVLVEGDTGISE